MTTILQIFYYFATAHYHLPSHCEYTFHRLATSIIPLLRRKRKNGFFLCKFKVIQHKDEKKQEKHSKVATTPTNLSSSSPAPPSILPLAHMTPERAYTLPLTSSRHLRKNSPTIGNVAIFTCIQSLKTVTATTTVPLTLFQ